MNYFDIIIFSVLAIAFVRGFFKGFFNELASFLGFFMGLIGAGYFSERCSKIILSFIEIDIRIVNILSFFILFISIAIIFSLIGKSLTKLVKLASLGLFNRVFGGIFRSLKFIIILSILVLLINYLDTLFSVKVFDFLNLETSVSFNLLEMLSETLLFLFENEMMFI